MSRLVLRAKRRVRLAWLIKPLPVLCRLPKSLNPKPLAVLCLHKPYWFISLPCLRQETLLYDPGLFHLHTELSIFPGGYSIIGAI